MMIKIFCPFLILKSLILLVIQINILIYNSLKSLLTKQYKLAKIEILTEKKKYMSAKKCSDKRNEKKTFNLNSMIE